MTRRAWSLAPLIALALVGCRRGERPRAATGRADSATGAKPDLSNPASAAMRQRAPGTFRARFETRKGSFVIAVQRDWAPLGADRFYNLVKSGYFDGARFFRVIPGFMAQFGIHGDPQVAAAWRDATIPDDPVRQPRCGELCDGGARHAYHAALHQLRRQQPARRHGIRPVGSGRRGYGRCGCAVWGIRRGRPPRPWPRSGPHPARGQRVPRARVPPARLRQSREYRHAVNRFLL